MSEQQPQQYKFLMFCDTSYNFNTPPTYTSSQSSGVQTKSVKFQSAIYKNIDRMNLENPADRWWMVKRCGPLKRCIVAAAKLKFNSHIAFYSEIDGTDEDYDLEKRFIKEFKGHKLFQQHAINVDTQGWSFIGEFMHPVLKKKVIRAVTEPEVRLKTDDWGFVTGVEYTPKNAAEPIFVAIETGIYHVKDDWEHDGRGTSEMAAAWDDCVWWALTMFSMAEYDARLGNGIHVVRVPEGLSPTAEDKMREQYENLTGRRYVMNYVSNDPNGSYGTEIVPPSQVDYPAHLDKLLESIAMSFSIPVNFLKGGTEGAMSTSTENGLAVKDKLEADFDEFVDDIIEFMQKFMKLGKETPAEAMADALPDPNGSQPAKPGDDKVAGTPKNAGSKPGIPALIEPRIELRMNELARAEVDLVKAQAAQIKMRFMSQEEIRLEYGLEGEVESAEQSANNSMLEKAGEVKGATQEGDKKQKPPEGKTEKEKATGFSDAIAASTFDINVTVRDRKDVWELEGVLGGEGFVDYSDIGRGEIYRSADAVSKAVELAQNSIINVGIEHVDGKSGEEVYNTNRVGVVTRLHKTGNQLMVKMAVEKAAVDAFFASRNEPNWVRGMIETERQLRISAGAIGSLKGTTQDLWEIRSVAITRNPRVKNALVSLVEPAGG